MRKVGLLIVMCILLFSTVGIHSIGSEEEPSRAIGNSDWPLFRGDIKHTALSPYSTSENAGTLKWSFPTGGRIRTSPVIGPEGNIYFTSDDGFMYALNSTGSQLWTFSAGNLPGSGVNDLYDSTPLVDSSGNVYVATDSGNMYSFNSGGAPRWKQVIDARGQLRSSPVMDDSDIIYIGSESSMSGGAMSALYSSNGTIKWRYRTDSGIISSPVIDSNGNILFGSRENAFFCLYPNGTLNWKETTNSAKGFVVSSPAIDESGNIYFGHYGTGSPGVLWSFDPSGGYNWDYSSFRDAVYSSPAIGPSGRIYIGSDDKALHAVNANDGSLFKVYMTNGKVISSPAVDKDGIVYVGSEDNYLYSIDPDMTLRWRFLTNGMIHSSPAISSDGSVLIGSDDGYLYSIYQGIPSVPRDLMAEGGDNKVILSWVEPEEDGGSSIIGYRLYKNVVGETPEIIQAGTPATGYFDTDVLNGKTYYYKISALNSFGESDRSPPVSATPMTVPDPITLFRIFNGSGFNLLSWDLPVDNGGSPLTNIKINRGMDEMGITNFTDILPQSNSFNDTSVINGEKYFYQIFVENEVGVSVGSEVVSAIPRGVPTEPLNLTAEGKDGYVILSWEPPVDMKGSPLIGYKIYSGSSMGSEAFIIDTIDGTFNHTDVENGNEYYYYIVAVNGVGTSERSESAMAIPMGLPSYPMNLIAIQFEDHIKLSWEEPEDNGGTEITAYRVYVSLNGEEFHPLVFIPSGDPLEYKDRGVSDPNLYSYKVTAINDVGESVLFAEANITFIAIPDPPTALSAVSGDGSVFLSWAAPEYDGGSPITGYSIYREDDGITFKLTTVGPEFNEYNDTTVFNGDTHYYSITALNTKGESGRTDTVMGRPMELMDAPSSPEFLRATLSDGRITVVWGAPVDDGGAEVEFYHLYRGVNENETILIKTFQRNTFSYIDSDIEPGNTYHYLLVAENEIGGSLPSEEAIITIEREKPESPPSDEGDNDGNGRSNSMIYILVAAVLSVIILAAVGLVIFILKGSNPKDVEIPVPVNMHPPMNEGGQYQQITAGQPFVQENSQTVHSGETSMYTTYPNDVPPLMDTTPLTESGSFLENIPSSEPQN